MLIDDNITHSWKGKRREEVKFPVPLGYYAFTTNYASSRFELFLSFFFPRSIHVQLEPDVKDGIPLVYVFLISLYCCR